MFKISESIIISMHALYILANKNDQLLSSSEIAEILGKSKNHVKIILNRLTKAGFIESVRGPCGGFKIIEKTLGLSLLEIYENIDGPMTRHNYCCFLDHNVCDHNCMFGDFFYSTNNKLKDYMDSKKLIEFVD